MIVHGVISTVSWRRDSFIRTMKSLAAQDRKLDYLLVIFDGEGHDFQTPGLSTAETASKGVIERINGSTDGAWSRVVQGWRWAKINCADLIAVFDDDIVYPPDYLGSMIDAASVKDVPIALGGTDATWEYRPYWVSSSEHVTLIEPNMGASIWPVRMDLDMMVEKNDVLREHGIVSKSGDTAVGYVLWRASRCVFKPAGSFIALPDPCAWDVRSLYRARGGSAHVWKVRRELHDLTGWPGVPLPESSNA